MLSSPPLSLARSMRALPMVSRSVLDAMTSDISPSGAMELRPSVQRRSLSPTANSISTTSAWAWSRVPDWCYYSKPPMVAWLIAASTHLLGTTAFTVRLPAALLNAGMVAALFLLGRAMFSAHSSQRCISLIDSVTVKACACAFKSTDADSQAFRYLSLALRFLVCRIL